MRAIIYARVSADQSGRGRSVSEQEAECRAICQREGWDVAEVLSDNDVGASRFSRVKDRPAYERLKQVLQAGDVLVLWEASRASRKLDGYVELRDLCAERGVLWNIGGQTYDPSRSNDRVMTGIRAIISEDEAHQIQQRVLRAHRANAERGLAHGKIPYGYRAVRDADTGKIVERVPDEGEAPIVREMVRRFLAGESVWAIAKDLNERGVSTPGSSPLWRASIMTQMLKRPTYAGLRTHRGVVTGRGEWEALISEDDHRAVVAALSDPSRRTHRGVEPKHLLTGIATCGECASVVWRLKSNGRSVYACPKGALAGAWTTWMNSWSMRSLRGLRATTSRLMWRTTPPRLRLPRRLERCARGCPNWRVRLCSAGSLLPRSGGSRLRFCGRLMMLTLVRVLRHARRWLPISWATARLGDGTDCPLLIVAL
ncbi:recombinase family protein [Rhodococcus hoagii]|nr:recombinase family protein [Prescottella equi]